MITHCGQEEGLRETRRAGGGWGKSEEGHATDEDDDEARETPTRGEIIIRGVYVNTRRRAGRDEIKWEGKKKGGGEAHYVPPPPPGEKPTGRRRG